MTSRLPPPPPPRHVIATRYVTPLREGGSVPALVEADDDGLYVLKLRGAAQGPKTLIAELLAGEIGRALGLPVPEIVFITLDIALSRAEPDPEIQAPLKASAGRNLGFDFLPGSLPYPPRFPAPIDPDLASAIVWFDAFVTNVDRTARNPNLLLWHNQLWLIDHGAALYIHHTWRDAAAQSQTRFEAIQNHILLPYASAMKAADARLAPLLNPTTMNRIVDLIPDDWLAWPGTPSDPVASRDRYLEYLSQRLAGRTGFVEEARRGHARCV